MRIPHRDRVRNPSALHSHTPAHAVRTCEKRDRESESVRERERTCARTHEVATLKVVRVRIPHRYGLVGPSKG